MNVGKPLPPSKQAKLRDLIQRQGLVAAAKMLRMTEHLTARAAAGAAVSGATSVAFDAGIPSDQPQKVA